MFWSDLRVLCRDFVTFGYTRILLATKEAYGGVTGQNNQLLIEIFEVLTENHRKTL